MIGSESVIEFIPISTISPTIITNTVQHNTAKTSDSIIKIGISEDYSYFTTTRASVTAIPDDSDSVIEIIFQGSLDTTYSIRVVYNIL